MCEGWDIDISRFLKSVQKLLKMDLWLKSWEARYRIFYGTLASAFPPQWVSLDLNKLNLQALGDSTLSLCQIVSPW